MLCLIDEVAEETVLKAVQSKDAAALPAAVPESQSRLLMPHDAIEPSKYTLLYEILALAVLFFFGAIKNVLLADFKSDSHRSYLMSPRASGKNCCREL